MNDSTQTRELKTICLSELKNGDRVIIITGSGSRYIIEILEPAKSKEEFPEIMFSGGSRFQKPIKVLRFGNLMPMGDLEPKVSVGFQAAFFHKEGKMFQSSKIASINFFPAPK
jgi:hypothetical protein